MKSESLDIYRYISFKGCLKHRLWYTYYVTTFNCIHHIKPL